jgi:hypothetical protein
LSAFIADYELFQIEISKGYGPNEWKDDLKSCLMKAGIDCKPTVFLFSDTQVCVSAGVSVRLCSACTALMLCDVRRSSSRACSRT